MAEKHYTFASDDDDTYTIDDSGFKEGYSTEDVVPIEEARFVYKLPSGERVYTNKRMPAPEGSVYRLVKNGAEYNTTMNAGNKEGWEAYQKDRLEKYRSGQKAQAEKEVRARKSARKAKADADTAETERTKNLSVKDYLAEYNDNPKTTASELVSKAIAENIPYDEFETMLKEAGINSDNVKKEFEKQYTPEIKAQTDKARAAAKAKAEAEAQAKKEAEEKEEAEENKKRTSETQETVNNAVKGAEWDANNNSIIGAITSPDSGYTGAQRVGMALKLIGQITGNAILANGMSLLGDNSYFGKIAESVNYENYKPEARKEAQKLYTEWISETAADTAANDKTLETLPLEPEVKNKLSQLGPEIAIIASDRKLLQERLATIGIKDPKVIDKVYAARTGFQYSSKKSAEALQTLASAGSANEARKQSETATKKADYEFDQEKFSDKAKIEKEIQELLTLKSQLRLNNLNERIQAIANYAGVYGQIGSVVTSAAKSNSLAKNAQSQWNVSTSASAGWGPFSAEISGGGGHSWGSNESTSMSNNSSETFNSYYKSALDYMQNRTDEWWRTEGEQMIKDAEKSIDEEIKILRAQQDSISVNDAVIPNGAIESVNLKNGETVAVNPDDGAVLTTNNVGPFLSFGEGEVNPFDYLGYDGEKKECAYYDTLFDDTPRHITSFDEALELLK